MMFLELKMFNKCVIDSVNIIPTKVPYPLSQHDTTSLARILHTCNIYTNHNTNDFKYLQALPMYILYTSVNMLDRCCMM